MKTRISEDKRNHFLDVLKGICIFFIVITHFSWSTKERLSYFFPFWIDMAVPIFMIISGYAYTLSYQKRMISCAADAYSLKNTIDKLLRYTIPFAIAYCVEILYLFNKGSLTVSLDVAFSVFVDFFNGGGGPGSYFFPIMIQFIFVFPPIFFAIKKHGFKGILACGVANAFYELLKFSYSMNESCYRLLVFRYILLISVGCYIANYAGEKQCHKNIKVFSLFSCALGLTFIVANCYLGYQPKIITYWTRTSFLASLYIIPIATILIMKLGAFKFFPLEIIGKASYNIFLVQMVWYRFVSGKIETRVTRPVHLAINLIACVGAGLVFYSIESRITKKVIKKCIFYISKFED